MHTYHPIFRVSPPAGPQYVVDLTAYRHVTICQPRPSPVIIEKQTINYGVRTSIRGVQMSVVLTFEWVTPSADEADFKGKVLDRAFDGSTLELSLDNGVVYREVVLAQQFDQVNMAGKNVGIILSTLWKCKEMIDTVPVVGAGSW